MTTVSVVVCTRNRAELLGECLSSVEADIAGGADADGEVEVIVVDNGSSDATPGLVRRWQRAGAHRIAVRDDMVGLSSARNRGLAVASGDVVAFLDDDALATPGWINAHRRCYGQGVLAAGGRVVLAFPQGRPRWATPDLEHWWSALDLGPSARPFPPPHGPYGTNLSVRRADAIAVGGFDVQLGRRGSSLMSSEEADLSARLWDRGGTIVYEPAATVVHQVTGARLRRRWIVRRALAQGRTNARRIPVATAPAVRVELAGLVRRAAEPSSALNAWSTRAGHLSTALVLAGRAVRRR